MDHFDHAAAALNLGAHVMIEKPMTTTARDARKLVELARSAGRKIIIPHGWNFTHYTRKAASLYAAGAIGELRHATLQMGSALTDLFGGDQLSETAGHFFRPSSSTWADPKRAGGYGWGQLVHALGLFFRIVPLDPTEIYGRLGRSAVNVDYYDSTIVTLGNGATCVISGCATLPKHLGYHIDLRLFGDKGTMLLDLERERLEVHQHSGERIVHPIGPGEGTATYSITPAIDQFIDVCQGRDVEVDADELVGLRSVKVLEGMYRSAEVGVPVAISRDY